MDAKPKAKGSWGIQFFIIILGIVLGILLFWLLGFVTKDIGNIPGPEFSEVRKKYVEQELDNKQKAITKDVKDIERRIDVIRQQQQILKDSSNSLQNTINQLLDTTGKFESTDEVTQIIKQSQAAFLKNQTKYEANNKQIAELTEVLNNIKDELDTLNETIKEKEKGAHGEFAKLRQNHRLKVAAIKLAFLLPVLIIASLFFMKKRSGPYWPLVWAFFTSSFLKIAFVVHQYFPKRYFKYIAIIVMIAIVLRILIYFIMRIVKPRKDLLLKQYQQLYDKSKCPVCSKPIRTNQTLSSSLAALKKKSALLTEMQSQIQQEYTCPSCGTRLYEKCQSCQETRHALLPYCLNCGALKK